jgi:hypothetical protein
MAVSVLAYNLTRVMNVIETKPMIAAIAAGATSALTTDLP